jgi:hypothetical protein
VSFSNTEILEFGSNIRNLNQGLLNQNSKEGSELKNGV